MNAPRMLCAIALLASGCGQPAEPPMPGRPPAPVTVAAAAAQDVPRYLEEIGRIVSSQVIAIRPQVTGRLGEVRFADGDDVKAGQELFTIDPRPFQARLDQAEASLGRANAAFALATTEYGRVARLEDARIVSKQDVEARRNAVDAASAQVREAQAAVDAAKLDLEYATIRSPIDARAGRRLVDAGNLVTANTTELVVLRSLDPVYAEFAVAEDRLADLRASRGTGPLPVEIRVPDPPGPARTGELVFMDNAVQPGTGTVQLRAKAPNADRHFWPGQFVRVRIILETLRGAVLIPASATQLSAQGPFVYVVKEDSTAELRPVTPGQRHGELVVIEKGLQAGERVVLEGQMGVMPGAKVDVRP